MRLTITITLLTLAGLWCSAGTASAQITSPYSRLRPGYPAPRPQLSPYLNLLRAGDPAANYYLGTIPEEQRRQQAQQFGSDIRSLEVGEQRLASELAPQDRDLLRGQRDVVLTSGHLTATNTTLGYFGNTANYYPTPQFAPPLPTPLGGRPRGR
jgi:hypothetical protein